MRPLALLHVNIKARLVALGVYKLSFNSQLHNGPIWFNHQIDILHLKNYCSYCYLFPGAGLRTKILDKLRFVILESQWLGISLDLIVRQCPELHELARLGPGMGSQHSDTEFIQASFRRAWIKKWGKNVKQPTFKRMSRSALKDIVEAND